MLPEAGIAAPMRAPLRCAEAAGSRPTTERSASPPGERRCEREPARRDPQDQLAARTRRSAEPAAAEFSGHDPQDQPTARSQRSAEPARAGGASHRLASKAIADRLNIAESASVRMMETFSPRQIDPNRGTSKSAATLRERLRQLVTQSCSKQSRRPTLTGICKRIKSVYRWRKAKSTR